MLHKFICLEVGND